MKEQDKFESIVTDMIKSYSNDYELGTKYRELSIYHFGFSYDGLLGQYPNNIELGKELRKIYTKK
jgi:hypothetical protein